MKFRQFLLFFLTFWVFLPVFSQTNWLSEPVFSSTERKHQFWIHWGYNRAQYSKSDIHFTGPGYDFTLDNVKAKDRQSPFNFDLYFNPKTLSIPQYNLRIGMFLTDNFSVSVGADHMKYVVVQNQNSSINGRIDSTASSTFTGTYENQNIILTNQFLEYEHTDGLNYLSANGDFFGNIYKKSNGKLSLDFFLGIGAGILFPRSDVDLFDVDGVNVFHVAGWGTDVEVGLRLNFYKAFYLNVQAKAGFIAMPNVLTVKSGHNAQQHFFFLQEIASLGFNINYFNKSKEQK